MSIITDVIESTGNHSGMGVTLSYPETQMDVEYPDSPSPSSQDIGQHLLHVDELEAEVCSVFSRRRLPVSALHCRER
jgi:hypothetical protein